MDTTPMIVSVALRDTDGKVVYQPEPPTMPDRETELEGGVESIFTKAVARPP